MGKDKYDDYDDNIIQDVKRINRKNKHSSNNRDMAKDKTPSASSNKKTKVKSKTFKQKIFIALGSVVSVYAVLIVILIASTYFNSDSNDNWFTNPTIKSPSSVITEVFSAKLPERTSFVILGTDEDGTRTDTIVVGCYNSVSNKIDLISVPRDTVISASSANYNIMRQDFPEPGSPNMKINTVHHYGGEKNGIALAVDELENLLGIKIDYYVMVNFDAFDYFIDSIGGIDFNVPVNMNYKDPTQNLYINLKAGQQTLNGDQAQQLVRFRSGYANADLGRIAVQQDFMKELIKKSTSSDTIVNNPSAYLKTFFKYVKTNVSIADAAKYTSALKSFDGNNIETFTLPGNAAYVSGISGYKVDTSELKTLVYDIFEKPINETLDNTDESTSLTKSYGKSIQVLNGGYTNGMATRVKEDLASNGYTVDSVGTYNDEKEDATRIYVSEKGVGEDLKEFFKNSIVEVDSSKTDGYDISIVIGIEEE